MASVGASFLRNTLNPIALLEGFQRGSLNRAQRGLYAGRQIGFGNSISFSESKYAHFVSLLACGAGNGGGKARRRLVFKTAVGQALCVQVTNDSCRDVRGRWHISCSEPCNDSVPERCCECCITLLSYKCVTISSLS
jgi:hypothetical protein